MKLEIRQVKNGVVFSIDGSEEIVYQERDDEDLSADAFAEILRFIIDEYGPSTSRYSAKRIYVEVRPGDKYEQGSGEFTVAEKKGETEK